MELTLRVTQAKHGEVVNSYSVPGSLDGQMEHDRGPAATMPELHHRSKDPGHRGYSPLLVRLHLEHGI